MAYKRKTRIEFNTEGTVTGRIKKPEADILRIEPRVQVIIELPADAAQALTEMSEGELLEFGARLGIVIISVKKVQ